MCGHGRLLREHIQKVCFSRTPPCGFVTSDKLQSPLEGTESPSALPPEDGGSGEVFCLPPGPEPWTQDSSITGLVSVSTAKSQKIVGGSDRRVRTASTVREI